MPILLVDVLKPGAQSITCRCSHCRFETGSGAAIGYNPVDVFDFHRARRRIIIFLVIQFVMITIIVLHETGVLVFFTFFRYNL